MEICLLDRKSIVFYTIDRTNSFFLLRGTMTTAEVLKGLASEGRVHEALDLVEGTEEQKNEQVEAIVEGVMNLPPIVGINSHTCPPMKGKT
jgi:hypothetical protein